MLNTIFGNQISKEALEGLKLFLKEWNQNPLNDHIIAIDNKNIKLIDKDLLEIPSSINEFVQEKIPIQEVTSEEIENESCNNEALPSIQIEKLKEELMKETNSTRNLISPFDMENNMQTIMHIINKIKKLGKKKDQQNKIDRLEVMYYLGSLQQDNNFKELMKNKLKMEFNKTKVKRIWKQAERTYRLYSKHGLNKLYEACHINVSILENLKPDQFEALQ